MSSSFTPGDGEVCLVSRMIALDIAAFSFRWFLHVVHETVLWLVSGCIHKAYGGYREDFLLREHT